MIVSSNRETSTARPQALPDGDIINGTLRFIAERAWQRSDGDFFRALVTHLAETLGVAYAFVDRLVPADVETAESVAFHAHGRIIENVRYGLAGTPCEKVITRDFCCHAAKVQQQFPEDETLAAMQAESYAGIPMWASDGRPLGLVAIIDVKPFANAVLVKTLLQIVALRAAAELESRTMVAELQESRQRFRDFAEASSDWFWEMDENLRFTWFSQDVERVTGVPAAWHYGKTREEIGVPDMPHALWEGHLETLKQHKPYKDFVFHRRGPDGDKWLRSSGVPVFASDECFNGYRGTGTDVTGEIEARSAADRAKSLLVSAIEGLDELFVLWGSDDRLIICNERFRLTNAQVVETTEPGTPFAEHIRTALQRGLYPSADGREEEWYQERIARHENPQGPFELARQDGVHLLINEQKLSDGSTVTISLDITQRKRQEQELAASKKRAESANRSKSRFLAIMSHEIRTPMNGVLGMASSLLGENLSSKQRRQVEIIKESGEALLDLLNDILDFSKIEAGKLSLEIVDVSIGRLIDTAEALWRPRIEAKGLSFTTNAAEIDCFVRTDAGRIRQILYNLIGNAIKFTDHGEIAVAVTSAPAPGGKVSLMFKVSDTGIGITEDHHGTLFQPFEQAEASTARQYGGTGLGLAISKQLTSLLGGTIGVDSGVGAGSTFWFTVTADCGNPTNANNLDGLAGGQLIAELNQASELKILLAEDNHINQKVIAALLAPLKCKLDIVADGWEAIQAVRLKTYDLILLDVQMPVMDGLTTAKKIRAMMDPTISQIAIIALTANAMIGDRESYLAAGMNGYVSKPINQQALFEAIMTCVGISIPTHEADKADDLDPTMTDQPSLSNEHSEALSGLLTEVGRAS